MIYTEHDVLKEKLTNIQIKKDLKGPLYHNFLGTLILSLVFFLLCMCFLSIFKNPTAITIISCIFIVLFIALFLSVVISIKGIIKANLYKFFLVTDELVEKTEGNIYATKWENFSPYILRFATHGNFAIPSVIHYKWSKLFDMNEQDLFYSSHVGDTFLLVSFNGKKIDMVYNTGMFEIIV